ncbi:GNAT family N-acetyltransferase [Nostoc flagelliforme]|uniref:GNAT family N-acetyltransferase n=1 Tax=Nostoc flagelliforme TaxID=1306274 RepID=UPI001F54A0F7|nr:GNAT family N-acetyltransferase [Nostoc flagelliforme]
MIEIVEADLSMPAQAEAMVQLMDEYALDPMGGGKGLSDYVKANIRAELAKRFAAHVILAFVDAEPAGLVVCLEGFSTFACKPLLNIHDVIVALPYRGRGLSKLLLQKAEEIALDLGCCKLTLEVLEGNHVAQLEYNACGCRIIVIFNQAGSVVKTTLTQKLEYHKSTIGSSCSAH